MLINEGARLVDQHCGKGCSIVAHTPIEVAQTIWRIRENGQ